MLVLIDDREIVSVGYKSGFRNEGVASAGLRPHDFREWVATVSDSDLAAVEAFLIGDCADRLAYPRFIRERSHTPIIAINDSHSLDLTLELFHAGFDDVVRKPVHVRELMARIDAIRRRALTKNDDVIFGDIRVFFDGRDPEIRGEPLALPRRERRILEYLIKNRGRRDQQDPDLQRDLRHLRRTGRRERGREPYQQASQEVAPEARVRPDRIAALSRLLPR